MLLTAPDISSYHQQTRTLLRIYAYYRAVLALVLLAIFHAPFSPFLNVLGTRNPWIFNVVINFYTLVSLITLASLYGKRFVFSDQHIFLICFIDVASLALLMHASGGIDSGLGLLLLVTVSAASITLSGGQIAALIAALAALAVLTSAILEVLYSQINNLLPAGLLGFLLFVTSRLFLYLTRRIQLSVEEAELQTRRRAETQQLNEMIVRRMRTGLLVLAPDCRIRLMNESAARLLDMPPPADMDEQTSLSFLNSPSLHESFLQWRASPRTRIKALSLREGGPELQLSFAGLHQNPQSDILVFVEDLREMAQQAQQLKLASLGRLTANIAHEVRNPLGAISHAAQLLAESENLQASDRRLSEIIQTHTRRVNQIIENVLQLSRRNKPQPEHLSLLGLLNHFVMRYRQGHPEQVIIDIHCDDATIQVTVDASQMEQVLNNLCDNGLRHSKQATGNAHVILHGYLDPSLGTPCLDIIDDGAGVSAENVGNIFEPFFTTESQGTGLGLYIAREICEANQAQLSYKHTAAGKSCFHIGFSHPDKSTPYNIDTY